MPLLPQTLFLVHIFLTTFFGVRARLTFVAGFAEGLNQHSAAINRKLESEFEVGVQRSKGSTSPQPPSHPLRNGNSLPTMLTSGWVVHVIVFDAAMVNVLML